MGHDLRVVADGAELEASTGRPSSPRDRLYAALIADGVRPVADLVAVMRAVVDTVLSPHLELDHRWELWWSARWTTSAGRGHRTGWCGTPCRTWTVWRT
jgi:hypothetical protein